VTALVVVAGAAALVGAGFLGAALDGEGEVSVNESDLAADLEAERARSFELESQLSAALRRIKDLREPRQRARNRRDKDGEREAGQGSGSGSKAGSREQNGSEGR
jgi:TolA-binding protein